MASKELEEKGEIIKVNNQTRTGIYTEAELTSYFGKLKAIILDPLVFFRGPIILLFKTEIKPHAITVGYDPTRNCWIFIDANNGYAERITEDKEISKKIIHGFRLSKSIRGLITLAHEMYATNQSGIEELEKRESELQLNDASSQNIYKNWWYSAANEDWLSLAVKTKDFSSMQKLLEAGINPNKPNELGFTPLYVASGIGYIDGVSALLEKGADLNYSNPKIGLTPLSDAFMNNQIETCIKLVKAGANPNPKILWAPILYWAIKGNHKDLVLALISAEEIDLNIDPNSTALIAVVSENMLEAVQFLIENPKTDLTATDRNRNTALSVAVQKKDAAVVEMLLTGV